MRETEEGSLGEGRDPGEVEGAAGRAGRNRIAAGRRIDCPEVCTAGSWKIRELEVVQSQLPQHSCLPSVSAYASSECPRDSDDLPKQQREERTTSSEREWTEQRRRLSRRVVNAQLGMFVRVWHQWRCPSACSPRRAGTTAPPPPVRCVPAT